MIEAKKEFWLNRGDRVHLQGNTEQLEVKILSISDGLVIVEATTGVDPEALLKGPQIIKPEST